MAQIHQIVTGEFTITKRIDQHGQLHLTLPGDITLSITESAIPAAAEQLAAVARWVAAIDGSDDALLRLAVEIVAEAEGLNPAHVARIHAAVENYLDNPPTAEERELLEAGK